MNITQLESSLEQKLHWVLRASRRGVINDAVIQYIRQNVARDVTLDEPAMRVLRLPLEEGGGGIDVIAKVDEDSNGRGPAGKDADSERGGNKDGAKDRWGPTGQPGPRCGARARGDTAAGDVTIMSSDGNRATYVDTTMSGST